MKQSKSSDYELLIRSQAGDKLAGSELCHRYFHIVRGFFHNKAVTDADIDELTLETFSRIFLPKEELKYDKKLRFRLFIIRTAVLVLRDHIRKRNSALPRFNVDEDALCVLDVMHVTTLAAEWGVKDIMAQVIRALRRIPFRNQMVVEMCFFRSYRQRIFR